MKNTFKCISETKECLEDFGKTLVLSEKVINDLIMFVIRFIYNDKKSKTLAESRVALWKKMKRKSMQRLPPDEDTLRLHLQRCNYVTHGYLNYMLPESPPLPTQFGWTTTDDVCVPIRYTIPPLPELIRFERVYEMSDSARKDDVTDASETEESDIEDTENEYGSDIDDI